MTEEEPTDKEAQELPPFVKTWRQFYRLLIGWLVFLILIFYAFTKYFE
ncbi:hypothetical protein [Pedobacter africanus]|uniref:Uncharacterized protein n=1 Tax=Pedobacter africanus TaxID=151894 RepID=A0A1W2DY91_9SPHI|nr:hypothetical protein [Pedobacter africanus]SMD02092.1 hypothetical protein SAMN04488524_4204 [Pedobacter africanus]